jgi:methyltransferase (TIGR00027 family)
VQLPDPTAAIAALSRAAHVALDAPPFVFEDRPGLRLANDPTVLRRGTFVARARYVEELVAERQGDGVDQFVILGAGLDTTALRRSDLVDRLRIFEVDEPGTQSWKQARIAELGMTVPDNLTFARVDFESDVSWVEQLERVGFARDRRSIVASTGVTQYITAAALSTTMRQIAGLPSGTTFACTFVLPAGSIAPAERELRAWTEEQAAERGAPWISVYEPDEMLRLAREAGFADVRNVSPADWNARYFNGRTDGLHAPSGEHLLVAVS